MHKLRMSLSVNLDVEVSAFEIAIPLVFERFPRSHKQTRKKNSHIQMLNLFTLSVISPESPTKSLYIFRF